MNVEMSPASDADYQVIANLARFYMYDMAEHAGWNFPPDGLFDSEGRFAGYWGRADATRPWPPEWRGFPFLIRVDGHPSGFALVRRLKEQPASYDMGEFFVARQYRRNGTGQRMATALFSRFPGQWQVREMPTNKAAQAFWRKIIADYARDFSEGQEVFAEYGNNEFVVQRFSSGT